METGDAAQPRGGRGAACLSRDRGYDDKFVELFFADEADAECESAVLAACECAEVGGIYIVDDGIGILAAR